MSKELAFTDDNDVVKYLDTTTAFNLALTADGVAFDLTNAKSILVKIANDDGYIMQQTIGLTTVTSPLGGTLSFPINQDIMNTLVPDDYDIEVWVTMNDGTQAIFPSDGTLGFSIEENLMSDTGEVIPVITFNQFNDQFNDMMEQMRNTVSNVKKGDKGDTGPQGPQGVQGPKGDRGIQGIQGNTGTGISSTTIQYQISSSATTAPTGIWSNNIVATTTTNPYLWMKATLNYSDNTTKVFYLVSQKGDKGDTGATGPTGPIGPQGPAGSGLVVKGTVKDASQLPKDGNQEGYCYFVGTDLYVWDAGAWKNCGNVSPDLSNYVTVADLNNGLSTKVNVSDMRKPASDVAGIEEVNAKQDKIGYTPADDSKVVHDNHDNTITANKLIYDLSKTGITPLGVYKSGSFNDLPLGTVFATNSVTDGPDSLHAFTTTTFYFNGWSTGRKAQIAIADSANLMYFRVCAGVYWGSWVLLSDDSKVVHSTDMRKPASDVAGIDEVNTKQDKIGYTPADDSKVVHNSGNEEIAGQKTFDIAPIDKTTGHPYITKDGVPAVSDTLADTTKDANFTRKLQKSGVDVATTTDVNKAVNTAVSPLNINTNWVSLSVDSSQIKDTDWDSTVTHCNYRIAHSTLYLTGKYKMLVTSNNKSRILFQLPTNIVSQISFPSTNEFQIGIIQAIARVPIMFMISLTNDGKISTTTSPYDMNSSNFGAQYGLGLINAAIPLN